MVKLNSKIDSCGTDLVVLVETSHGVGGGAAVWVEDFRVDLGALEPGVALQALVVEGLVLGLAVVLVHLATTTTTPPTVVELQADQPGAAHTAVEGRRVTCLRGKVNMSSNTMFECQCTTCFMVT